MDMRVLSRVALVLTLVVCSVVPLSAQRLTGDCPLSLVGSTPPTEETNFNTSPHGVFRFGNLVFALRGSNLTTYSVTDLGDLQIVREDPLGSLAGRESVGGA